MKPLHVLVLTSAISQFAFLLAQFTLLLYVLHLQVSPTVAGLLVSLGGLGPAIIAVGIGKFIDRRGGRSPMLLALIGQIAGAILPLVWDGIPILFLASFINGTAFIIFRVGAQQAIGRVGPVEARAANYGLLGLGYSAASIAAPLFGGFSIEHVGHLPTFIASALLVIVPLGFIATGTLKIPGPAMAAGSAASHAGSAFALLAEPTLRRVFITTVLINGAWDVFMFLVPLYGSQLHFSASQIGLLSGSFAGGSLFIRAITALLLRRFSPWQILIMALAMSGLSFASYPLLGTIAALIAVAFIAGMGMGVALPITISLAFDAAPPERAGEVIGLRLSLSMASAATLPLLCGALGAAFGIAIVYWIEGTALLCGAWLNRMQWRHRRAGSATA